MDGCLSVGEDADGIVTVTVDDAANVVSVKVVDVWEDAAARRALGAKVVEAVRAATARALAKQAGQPASAPAVRPSVDESPLTSANVLRLLHEVSTDLDEFRQRISTAAEPVTVTSGGGHVTVSGRRRQVSDVSIDQDWLYRALVPEVESELREALTAFGTRSAGELVPESGAISELRALVSDPEAMVRRIRRS